MIELIVPEIGESITEVIVASWLKDEGAFVEQDEPIAELETDKATVELPAPQSGILTRIIAPSGSTAQVGDTIGKLKPTTAASDVQQSVPVTNTTDQNPAGSSTTTTTVSITPSARRLATDKGLDPNTISGTGKHGTVLKEDVMNAAQAGTGIAPTSAHEPVQPDTAAGEEIIPMSPIRKTIARRLLESQQTTAQLTTFNEVDMSAVISLRKQYKDTFITHYGIKLGFMSFFIKAAIEALKAFPSVNAELRDETIVYKNYYNVGIAVGGGKGLVVPVMREAHTLSFAQTELAVADFARRGAENKIALNELSGGTFTISNGGVYGSLMGTPILNPPQSGILGLHAIKERAMVINGQIEPRPMMYLALTYDHRVVDGRESVGFLNRIRELIEDPTRILLEI